MPAVNPEEQAPSFQPVFEKNIQARDSMSFPATSVAENNLTLYSRKCTLITK